MSYFEGRTYTMAENNENLFYLALSLKTIPDAEAIGRFAKYRNIDYEEAFDRVCRGKTLLALERIGEQIGVDNKDMGEDTWFIPSPFSKIVGAGLLMIHAPKTNLKPVGIWRGYAGNELGIITDLWRAFLYPSAWAEKHGQNRINTKICFITYGGKNNLFPVLLNRTMKVQKDLREQQKEIDQTLLRFLIFK